MGTTENESAWSTTAGTNATADLGIVWSEGQDAATVNNSARGMMAARAKARLDQGGERAAGGTANAITFTTNQVLSAAHVAAGLTLKFRATATNTGATTLAPDGLSAVAITDTLGRALTGGEIQSGAIVEVAYNANTSKWQLVSGYPTPGTFLLASGTASGATLDIVLTAFTIYRGIRIVLGGWIPVTNGVNLCARFSTDGGGTYDAGAAAYAYSGMDNATGFSAVTTLIQFNNQTINNSQGINLEALILNQTGPTFYSRLTYHAAYLDTVAGARFVTGGGMRVAAQDTDAIRFLFSSGNINSGNYAVYGLI